jgi:Polyketide cyclase / dehydrase and lipid transport
VNNQYHFLTRWRFAAAPEDIFAVLSDPLEYSRWWPSVYLMVREIEPGRVRMLTRGWLPYKIRWVAESAEKRAPERIVVRAHGDFEGEGVWSIVRDGAFSDVTFDWRLTAEKPLLRYLTFLLRPAFEANHRWAMEQGRRSLELELQRYRAATVEEMNRIPGPPRAADLMRRDVLAGAIIAAALFAGIAKTPR